MKHEGQGRNTGPRLLLQLNGRKYSYLRTKEFEMLSPRMIKTKVLLFPLGGNSHTIFFYCCCGFYISVLLFPLWEIHNKKLDFFIIFFYTLVLFSLVGNSGCPTQVRHGSHNSRATRSNQCVRYFPHVQSYGCQCFGIFNERMRLHTGAERIP